MADLKDTLARARSEAQDIHKKIQATTAKNHAAVRADLKSAGDSAKNLAASLKAAVEGQRDAASEHVKEAAANLDEAWKQAQDVAGSTEAQLKDRNRAMLDTVRDSLQHLSEAVATQRAKMVKA